MISVSILSIKDDNDKILEIDSMHPNYIHIDVMDGLFVDNKVDMLNLPMLYSKRDVHLMVYDVKGYIDKYIKYEPEYITFHYEAVDNIEELVNYIHSFGIKAGLSIKPNTDVDSIKKYLNIVDLVLVMSVEPGHGGQKFIYESKNKIDKLYDLKVENNYNYVIEVDGGVNTDVKDLCKKADIMVVGSYITSAASPIDALESMNL